MSRIAPATLACVVLSGHPVSTFVALTLDRAGHEVTLLLVSMALSGAYFP